MVQITTHNTHKMYVCIYACTCRHMYIGLCMYVCMYACMYVCMYVGLIHYSAFSAAKAM